MADDFDNVVFLNGGTEDDIPTDRVLQAAIERNLESVIVLGYDADGDLYMAYSTGDVSKINLLLDLTKAQILNSFLED